LYKPNLKIAWDFFDPGELPLYLDSWEKVASPYFMGVPDYMPIQPFLRDALEKIIRS
jgi:hypothetical protein